MYLRVVSSSLQPDEISERVGVQADESMSMGTRRRPESPPRRETTWIRRVEVADDDARPEQLEPVIIGWGLDFAHALGRLVDSGEVVVFLEIVQEIIDLDDAQAKGIFVGAELMTWLSIARASLDIDQYIYHDCYDGDS